ncbi:hypothetical protein SAMN05421747_12218 [Parapedobacter composti]|uniref:Uncharacterized protein n=1 Tax=Parapedobacter composti TaxID=623281 RepID=A0A1I1LJT9_9SPHI|nr:hypothetical protein SAMN05421747_12218 [Parapedobacter composti]
MVRLKDRLWTMCFVPLGNFNSCMVRLKEADTIR